ncbi:MAG TPA: EF-P lysine aminoacylase EpmA [Gammaproteobacteria bacterium]
MSYRPGATHATLRARAALLDRVRAFFAARGVLEVETPTLSRAGAPDPALSQIEARVRSLGPGPCYLHTSPEYAMKRLLAAGSGDIYQLCRVYRDDELGRWHQPEFTLLEWYRVGFDDARLMDEVDELLQQLLGHRLARPSRRLTYAEAFERAVGASPHAGADTVRAALGKRGVEVPPGLEETAVLDLAFGVLVANAFEPGALTFVHDFPATHAALAKLKPGPPPVAARFEVFAGGIELGNGFAELTDPVEQRRRFEADNERRRRTGQPVVPLDEDFLAALATLPECAGVALGVDRIVALAEGLPDVASAMAFAHSASRNEDRA